MPASCLNATCRFNSFPQPRRFRLLRRAQSQVNNKGGTQKLLFYSTALYFLWLTLDDTVC